MATFLYDESRVGRSTHYMLTLNVSGSDFEHLLRQKHIAKIEFNWGKMRFPYQVVVIPREFQTKQTSVPAGVMSYTPPSTYGDGDFDTDDGNPLQFRVTAESRWWGNLAQVRLYMWAHETEDDYTTAEGWSAWKTVYTADPGWQIVGFSPSGLSRHEGAITDHNLRSEQLPAGELVQRFEIYGDTDGNEAGSYTRVAAFLNPLSISVTEVGPTDSMEWGIDYWGADLVSFQLPRPDPVLCMDACLEDLRCDCWTYRAGPVNMCWLKYEIPAPRGDPSCISGRR